MLVFVVKIRGYRHGRSGHAPGIWLVAEVNGEKVVTRHILEQTRRNGDDLAALKTRVGRVEEKVDLLDRKVDRLIKDLPRVVGDTMREVMRESGKRK